MARSVVLGLYLLLAERGTETLAGSRHDRPKGDLVWLHAGTGSRPEAIRQLLTLIDEERPDVSVLLTGLEIEPLPTCVITDNLPPDHLPPARAFLDHWKPGAALFVGSALPPALLTEAHRRQIPLILAEARLPPDEVPFWRRGLAGSVLARFDRILAPDPDAAESLLRLGVRNLPVELAGRIEETTEPLDCNEPEREAMADLLKARPVWLAVACPEAEEETVIAAHVHATSYAHRLLLILMPADPARGPALAKSLSERGIIVAERAAEQEVEAETQVLITDGPTELGLWYRLAPVTYMGGTLTPDQIGRTPFEPAALGSAIVHGPHFGPYPDAYARLGEARATRPVRGAGDLAATITDLIAPDKAATLAHNAWMTTSVGAEVASRVIQTLFSAFDAASKKGAE